MITRKIILEVGEVYHLQLENKAGSGLAWIIENNDESITSVKFRSTLTTKQAKEIPLGGASKIYAEIQALSKGASYIILVQKRIWQKNAPAASKMELTVVVDEKT